VHLKIKKNVRNPIPNNSPVLRDDENVDIAVFSGGSLPGAPKPDHLAN
jgi:hypothetical protein